VQRLQDSYRPQHLDHAGLVFAATNDAQVNAAVVGDAQARGILVSRADQDDDVPGDFAIPARFAKGPVTVAISAGSAALSVMIRDQLASQWEPLWTALAEAMIELRPEIKKSWDEPTRRSVFRDLATAQAMEVLASGGIQGLRDWITRRYAGRTDGKMGTET
jgi:siroheme synthase-like protein